MRCSKCGGDNREGRKFCTTCGTALVASCPKCGARIQPGESFCGQCGTALGEAAPAAAADTTSVTAFAGGERRHLTVLFCDLVGSTEIAARLDPEEWREIVADYHCAAAQAIERYGGHVAQYLGDGVIAYFGYPEAHDNDVERAARAGLAILDAISKLNQPSKRPELSARIGIDSGTVVVGASAGKGAEVFGETPNIAARVQAAAEPGTVVITDAAHRLVSGLFVVAQLGAQALKGIARPVQLYRVIQPSGVHGRLGAVTATGGLTPFVGREDELRVLMNRWESARSGEGQVALIIGEAGIGKSRLLQRFHEQIGGTPHTWIEAYAGVFFQNTPFYPVTELLQQFLGGKGGKPAEEQLAQLEPQLELAGLEPAETIPLVAALMNLPISDKYPQLPFSPEQQRRRLLATLVEWVLGAARVQPLIIVTEDLHWADASTLELIQLLVEQGATARLLLLHTARPEFHPQWPRRSHHTQITLNRLSARDIRTMLHDVAARKALSDETIEIVVERTGGVPLFVEELTRTVIESGSVNSGEREIPVTLHDSLMARLDRLGPAKEVAQVGAVIGSEFSYELLEAVLSMPINALQAALAKVADAELIYARGIPPEATYKFKHALIRDAAYEALLKSRRKDLHRLIAQTISEKFPAFKASHPEVLARHWAEAGETEEAIAEWSRASKAAEARNALVEALESLQQALALNPLPESPEVQTMASGGGSDANYSQPADSSRRRGRPDVFPLLPLRGLVAFPHVLYPIFVGRPKSIKAIAHAYQHSTPILLVTQRDPYPADPARYDMYEIGTIAAVVEMLALPDGTMKSVVRGMGRARISRFIFAEEFFQAEAEPIEEPTVSDIRLESLTRSVLSAFLRQRARAASEGANQPEAFEVSATTTGGVSVLADRMASESRIELVSKQTLLEILDPFERMEKLLAHLNALG